jgi:hypothetical protein
MLVVNSRQAGGECPEIYLLVSCVLEKCWVQWGIVG